MNLETSLLELHGIGTEFLKKFKRLGIGTVRDLLYHFPFRYEDWSQIVKIADLKIGEEKTIQGIIKKMDVRRAWQKRMTIVEAVVEDGSGEIKIIWFNQPYIGKVLKPGTLANFAGKLSINKKNEAYLSNPAYELVGAGESVSSPDQSALKHTGRLVPIYPETKGLTSKGIRYLIKPLLENIEPLADFIPESMRHKHRLLEINEALKVIHFPEKINDAENAKYRFAFEELFLLQLRNIRQKLALKRETAPEMEIDAEKIKALLTGLPYELTETQKKALWEIVQDLQKPYPMNRLLQGDVGSGKTVVAGIAGIAASNSHQVAIMAPTEILARQHYKTFIKLFGNFDGGIALMLGKESKAFYGGGLESNLKKKELLEEISSGKIKIIIGTHALIQKGVKFKNLGLVVIDEQHRFGVEQRAKLVSGKTIPHFLSMSATPIPRTMMIAIFGDLDLSIISELPKGRKEIITKVVAPENRDKAYAFIRGQVRRGSQVYVICPRIEKPEAELMDYKMEIAYDAKAVEEEYKRLSKTIFPDLRVAMLHGKMKGPEKEKAMTEFAEGKADILVATSVIEVGVDVPNATIMMIESAERFGLAQLYQFRGRVGRGHKQSFCFLFTDSKSDISESRLKSLVHAKNGYELAEKDLELRGPGQFMGSTQTGLPDIAMKSLQNPNLIKEARASAEKIMNDDPELEGHPLIKERLEEFKREVHME